MTTRAAGERTQAKSRPQLLFVIPAFNEEENLPNLFADLVQTSDLLGAGSRIFIVDDGSADNTPPRGGVLRPAAGRARPASESTRARRGVPDRLHLGAAVRRTPMR